MKYIKEPVNALTHLSAAILLIPATLYLILSSHGMLPRTAFLIFGLSAIALYTASAVYHTLRVSPYKERILRKVDHSMIFILIAGSYTPICLISLKGPWGYSLLIVIWVFAVAGVLMKVFWIGAPRWLSTAIYLIMGWLCIFAFYPIVRALTAGAMFWLVAGGLFYTVGAVIYGRRKCLLHWKIGFHEIFHVFIMLGTACHYITMLQLM